MFSPLERVNDTHKMFLDELTLLLEQDNPTFGPLFIKYVSNIYSAYYIYIID